jgi:hypothetical protein
MTENINIIDDEKRAMLKRKGIIWSVALIAVVVFFFLGIPINYMKSMLTFLAILAGITITVCALMVFFAITFFFFPKKKDNPYEGYIIGGSILLILFGSGVLMIFREMSLEKKELANYGVITNATVVDGSAFATRKMDFTKIKLVFTMVNGEEYTVDESISYKNFDRFYQGQKVPIIYSTQHPTILEILYRQDDMYKYQQIIHDRKK